VDGHPLKIHIAYFKVDDLLATQSGRINERQHDSLFQECGGSKKLLELCTVKDDGELGVAL
jgi:hypothetical protein